MGVEINKLKIIAVNVNSILSNCKRFSLVNFINLHKPNIVLLSETKLNSKYKISFENYKVVRNDRRTAIQGGGTGILVKNDIKYKTLYFNNLPMHNSLETSAIQINCRNNKTPTIISAYAAGHNRISIVHELNNLFEQNNLLHNNNYFVIAGDLNARTTLWGDAETNPRGGYLNNWIRDRSIELRLKVYPPTEPTFPRGNSYLDSALQMRA